MYICIYIYIYIIYICIYIDIYILWSRINAGYSSPMPNGANRNTIFLLKINMEV